MINYSSKAANLAKSIRLLAIAVKDDGDNDRFFTKRLEEILTEIFEEIPTKPAEE
jgi:hypothetical protein